MLSKAPRPLPQRWASHPPTLAHYNGTQQRHHGHSSKVGPHPPPNQSTLQWHPAMAPRPLRQWHHVHSPKVGRHSPPNHSTLQWHLTKAPQQWHHVHCTLQWHHVHSTIAHYNGTLQRHPAMAAHYNGTLQRHPAMAPRPLNHSTLQWHPATAPSNGTTSIQP